MIPKSATMVPKPWGYEEILVTEPYVVKRLVIRPGQRLSKQYHVRKTETLIGVAGAARVEFWDAGNLVEVTLLSSDMTVHVPARRIHRIGATTATAIILEVSTPELDDVVRLEDDYGRIA